MSSNFLLARIIILCHDARMVTKELTAREMQSMGGRARADKMTAKQRKDSARKAAQARWSKVKKAAKP